MRLKLILARSDGSHDDIVVTADAAASIEDVARAIATRDPRGADVDPGTRLTLRRLTPVIAPAADEWVPLPPAAQLGDGWLASGSQVAIADAALLSSRAGAATAVLEVLSGPQRGRVWSLGPGTSIIGREPGCDVVLEDRYVSGRHARVEVAERVDIVDLGSANGLEVDGEPVGRIVVQGPRDILIGETVVRVRTVTELMASAPVEAPRRSGGPVMFNRSPRVEPRYAGETFASPTIPLETEPNPFPWLAMAAPVLLAVALAVLTGRLVALLFVLMSPVMVLGGFLVNRSRAARGLARSIARFEARLALLGRDIDVAFGRERETRLREAPSTSEVALAALTRSGLLWTRRPEHWSFLNVRLGTGAMRSRSTIEAPDRGELIPELQERVDSLIARYRDVPDAPIVENLYDAGAIGCAGAHAAVAPVLNGAVAQLIGLHAPSELAVAAIVTPRWADELEWLKWAPHTSSPQSPLGARAHLVDSAASGAELLCAIEGVVEARLRHERVQRRGALGTDAAALLRGAGVGDDGDEVLRSGTRSPIPALVVVVSDEAPVDRARLVRLSEIGPDAGVFPIWVGADVASLPSACRTVIEAADPDAGAVSFVRLGIRVEPARLDPLSRAAAMRFARSLAPLVDAGVVVADASDMPRTVPLAEIIGHELFESEDAVVGRWRENDSIADRAESSQRDPAPRARRRSGRLRALVGVAGGDAMHLDLRAQGPHALVGGTTGTGKSEFLQAWVLGMAVEYSPDRVAFLFVDYKGGSAFAHCVRLPHCVGLVTDLSPPLVRRALTSLHAELHHRERLFNRKQAKDLLDLERRRDPEAPPALVLVIDEFAALANEVPEFVDGVIDIAQRGRALGIHLIIATQRPAGVVKDNLRANTNLRIALRMADESDSLDVVGVRDAAHFDPDVRGRAMARSGPGRLQTFQSAYAGGWTRPRAQGAEVVITQLRFGSESEWPLRVPPREDDCAEWDLGPNDQQRLVTTISAAAQRALIPAPRRPWLDELPSVVDLATLWTRDDARIPFGLSDDPTHQRRVVAFFRPDVDGHIAFSGTGGAGKSVALRTLALASAMTPGGGPVHVYALDFAAGSLRMLAGLPHVGAVIPGDDVERIQRLLRRLRTELEDRAKRYSAASAASIAEYRENARRPDEPRILLLIDGFTAFREDWELTLGRAGWYDVFKEVLTGGRQLGLHVALTADRPGALPGSIGASVQCRVVLRLADDTGHHRFGAQRDLLDESSPPGRALVDGLETQIAVLGAQGTASTASDQAGALATYVELHGESIPSAPPIESLPELVPAEGLPPDVDG